MRAGGAPRAAEGLLCRALIKLVNGEAQPPSLRAAQPSQPRAAPRGWPSASPCCGCLRVGRRLLRQADPAEPQTEAAQAGWLRQCPAASPPRAPGQLLTTAIGDSRLRTRKAGGGRGPQPRGAVSGPRPRPRPDMPDVLGCGGSRSQNLPCPVPGPGCCPPAACAQQTLRPGAACTKLPLVRQCCMRAQG